MNVVSELRREYDFKGLLGLAAMPRSTYYHNLKRLDRPDRYKALRSEIRRISKENNGRYGYRRVHLALANQGIIVNHKVVMRLMKEEGLTCRIRMKKYRSYRGEVGKIAQNVIQRNFQTDQPYKKLATDVTQFALFGKKLYLSPLLDLFNGEILSYALSYHPELHQVTHMLEQAFEIIPKDARPIVHSDQGWQYQHRHYQRLLSSKGWIQSMSRKGNCLDNAVMENFFGLLKSEFFYDQEFESLNDFETRLEEYIHYYNTRRIKVKLKGMSPVDYRTHSSAPN